MTVPLPKHRGPLVCLPPGYWVPFPFPGVTAAIVGCTCGAWLIALPPPFGGHFISAQGDVSPLLECMACGAKHDVALASYATTRA